MVYWIFLTCKLGNTLRRQFLKQGQKLSYENLKGSEISNIN